MRRQEDLQVKLRERHRKLLTADHQAYMTAIKTVRGFIEADSMLMSILTEAARLEPTLDVDAFMVTLGQVMGMRTFDWPHTTEAGEATLVWELMKRLDDGTVNSSVVMRLTGERNFNDGCRRFTEMMLGPLFDYLIERVGDQSSVLHALERYARQVEWFDRAELLEAFEANSQRGEDVYDRHLREFLFREGIDMPFSQARGPSGDSDALTMLNTDDPLVAEVKVFEGGDTHRNKKHIAVGLHQAYSYAQDYRRTEAYLVVINVSGRPVEVPTDGDDRQWPPYIDLGNVRIFVVVVRGRRVASASNLPRPNPVVFSRDALVDPDAH